MIIKEWPLKAVSGRRIQLTFESFDLEPCEDEDRDRETSCSCDYVEVSSAGSFSNKFCGDKVPDPITSTGNTMTVRFRSDGLNNQRGFSAKWKEVI